MTNLELTEEECSICMSAVMKCILFERFTQAGIPMKLTNKNYGFPQMTDEEEDALIKKLHGLSQIAFLKSQR